jgi:hypothetical protein
MKRCIRILEQIKEGLYSFPRSAWERMCILRIDMHISSSLTGRIELCLFKETEFQRYRKVTMCKLQHLAIALSMALLFGCNSGSGTHHTNTAITEETLYIDHYKTHCTTGPNGLCLRGKLDVDDVWYSDIDGIHDFHFQWGHRYKLQVRKEKDTDPETVGGGTDYFLLNVLEDNIVEPNTLFTLFVLERGGAGLIKEEENLYWYEGDKLVACKPSDCSAIEALQDQDLEILVEVTYQEPVDDPLMITQVLCAAPSGLMFEQDCPDEE